MAYDSMLYRATITNGQTVILNQIVGSGTVRQGYGTPRLISVQAFYHSTDAADNAARISIEMKNNTWVRPMSMWAGEFNAPTSHAKNTTNYTFMHGYSVPINSTFIVTATSLDTAAYQGTVTVDVLITINYDAIESINPDNYEGCPITMICSQSSGVTGAAGQEILLGSYDVLDPGVTYCLNEVSTPNVQGMMYLLVRGLQPQMGLIRLIPVPPVGARIVPTIIGSVAFTKQSFDLLVLSDGNIQDQIIPIYLELLANKNSLA